MEQGANAELLKNLLVLIIEDEAHIRRALQVGLEHNGYAVAVAATGEAGLDAAALHPPAIILLDLGLPDMDGLGVCRRVREWSRVPVMVLSVHAQEQDKIAALDVGVDDYLTKPFSLDELMARMRAMLRRTQHLERGNSHVSPLILGGLCLDFGRRCFLVEQREVHLTPIEYTLLKYLTQHSDRVVTYRQLLVAVWGPEYAQELRTLRTHIANLRAKIEAEPARPRYLHTEPHIGYSFGGADSREVDTSRATDRAY